MKRIGEILIENGSITQEQLQDALQFQKKESGKLIGKILIELGYVTEEDIVIALATQFNVPYLPLANFTFTEANAKILPRDLIVKYHCVPLERTGNMLTIAMSDPTCEEAIRAIEEATKAKVQTFVTTHTEIMHILQKHFHIDGIKEDLAKPSVQTQTFHNNASKTARKA